MSSFSLFENCEHNCESCVNFCIYVPNSCTVKQLQPVVTFNVSKSLNWSTHIWKLMEKCITSANWTTKAIPFVNFYSNCLCSCIVKQLQSVLCSNSMHYNFSRFENCGGNSKSMNICIGVPSSCVVKQLQTLM